MRQHDGVSEKHGSKVSLCFQSVLFIFLNRKTDVSTDWFSNHLEFTGGGFFSLLVTGKEGICVSRKPLRSVHTNVGDSVALKMFVSTTVHHQIINI